METLDYTADAHRIVAMDCGTLLGIYNFAYIVETYDNQQVEAFYR